VLLGFGSLGGKEIDRQRKIKADYPWCGVWDNARLCIVCLIRSSIMSLFKRKKNNKAPSFEAPKEEEFNETIVEWCLEAMKLGMSLTDVANKMIGCSKKLRAETFRTFVALQQINEEENQNAIEEKPIEGTSEERET